MKKNIIVIAVAAVIVLAAAGILGRKFYRDYQEKHQPSTTVMPLAEHYDISGEDVMIIIDETVYGKKGLWRNDTVYLDLETVTSMYDHRFFWVESENTLFYSTPDKIYKFFPAKNEYLLNREAAVSDVPVVETANGTVYISINFLENCGITCRVYDDPHRILITYSEEEFLATTAKEDTQIRVSQDIKADILKEVAAGDKLRYIDGGGIRQGGFIKVMSEDGVRGYISEAALEESGYEVPAFVGFEKPEYRHVMYPGKVYLGWQMLYTEDSLGYLNNAIALAPEMNVISPTWFYMNDTEGGFLSYANREYVDTAHSKGLQVWALYKNDTIDGAFSCSEDSHKVLSSTTARTALIDNIMASVEEYDLDGINIDFEMLKVDTGVYFIQFLRELSVLCHKKGIILSVDNYVPEGYNAYYDLAEQSEIIDYIIIMGYDEHYAGSSEAGSVSSLAWYEKAIENTCAKCDPERVIMGVPFYTRLWKENGDSLTVEATPGMAEAAAIVKKAGAGKDWKESAGQYYAEWKNGGTYKIWLEDADSLRRKVLAAREKNMAGIAAWKLGDETEGIWAVIVDAMEGKIEEDQ